MGTDIIFFHGFGDLFCDVKMFITRPELRGLYELVPRRHLSDSFIGGENKDCLLRITS